MQLLEKYKEWIGGKGESKKEKWNELTDTKEVNRGKMWKEQKWRNYGNNRENKR